MKLTEIADIVKKDVPLHYRNEYTATALFDSPEGKRISQRIEFVVEMSPVGSKDIRINFVDPLNYPLVPILRTLKEAIRNLDSKGFAALTSQFLPSARATKIFGKKFAASLGPGSVVLLEGPLGAGKTTLAQGLALGLGVVDDVTSPTFALVHEYRGRVEVFHMDLYRLASEEEFELIGGWEYFEKGGVCLIEWAERLGPTLTFPHWTIQLEISGQGRLVTVLRSGH